MPGLSNELLLSIVVYFTEVFIILHLGSVKGRPVSSFSVMDIKDRKINYVQSNHTGVEPLTDTFDVYVTDGHQKSDVQTVTIDILPQNDEVPKINIGLYNCISLFNIFSFPLGYRYQGKPFMVSCF